MKPIPFIEKLNLVHYRSIRSQEILFDNPTVFVGRNSSGKSNILDSLAFLADCMRMPLTAAFEFRGGRTRVMHASLDAAISGFYLQLQIDVRLGRGSHERGQYSLSIGSSTDGVFVSQEKCNIATKDNRKFWFNRTRSEFESNFGSVLPQLDEKALLLPIIGGLKQVTPLFAALAGLQVFAFDPGAIREGVESDDGRTLYSNGANVANVLDRLASKDEFILQRVAELLSPIVPGISEVSVTTTGDKKYLSIGQLSRSSKLQGRVFHPLSAMSDGTLRVLALIVAVLQQPSPTLMAFEEPESTIHPGALTTVSELIHAAARRSQIIVSTHSPDFLDSEWIDDDNIRMVTWNDGCTSVAKLGKTSVAAIRQHLMSPGELLRANALDAASPDPSEHNPELSEATIA